VFSSSHVVSLGGVIGASLCRRESYLGDDLPINLTVSGSPLLWRAR
jgi:hypothetical protein